MGLHTVVGVGVWYHPHEPGHEYSAVATLAGPVL